MDLMGWISVIGRTRESRCHEYVENDEDGDKDEDEDEDDGSAANGDDVRRYAVHTGIV